MPVLTPKTDPYDGCGLLQVHIAQAIEANDGWIGFDAVMAHALYAQGLGYYSRLDTQIGAMPGKAAGSDFVTAPTLSPLFGRALARQVAQALGHTGTRDVYEFGPGTGELAAQVLGELAQLGHPDVRYHLIDVSASLRARQQRRLAPWAGRVDWLDTWPDAMRGVVLGNELLDAMPVQLLHRVDGVWMERGVSLDARGALVWADRPTALRPPHPVVGDHDYLTEIHPQALAWVRSLGERLVLGAAFLIDYGFPAAEYYHPQRHMGTLMCHRAHQADADPLTNLGLKDITAHVNFTAVALAGNEAGLGVLGYTSQARFLMNCGMADLLAQADRVDRIRAQPLVLEHEMGELFKVLGFYTGEPWSACGFDAGDRTHTL